MSTNTLNPINVRLPIYDLSNEEGRQAAHRYVASGIVDLNQAIAAMTAKVNSLKTVVSTISTTSGGGSTPLPPTPFPFIGLGAVNDQTGNTAYTTLNTDNGILLVLNDASPVAVTLDSALTTPYFLFVTNFGAGTATLTPTTGLINGGASYALLRNYFSVVVFDGINWTGSAALLPANTPAITHEFLTSYSAITGAFTQAQPAFTDISGNLDISQLPVTGLSDTIVTAALTGGGTQGSMTFTNGLLTAQTPAT